MRKFLKAVIICTALLGVSNGVHAVGQRVEYVNGIQNTRDDAIASLHKIECTLMDGAEILQKNPANTSCFNTVGSPNHRPVKRDFVVDYTWNPIGWWGTVDITDDLQDWQELFTLKTVEERCIGLLLALKQAVSANDSVAVANTAMPLQNYASNLLYGENSSNNELVRDGDVDAARMALTQGVISGLLDKMSATDQTIIVAHSEGNLLAHLAYAKFAALLPVSAIKNVRIVNVGNTAQFSMHDLNLTNADDDALYGAVSGLKHLADRFDWIRTTPSCNDSDCDFAVDSPTMKAPEGSDFYDHDFKEVYLSDREVEVNEWRGVNYTPDKKRFRDRFEDLVYTAADSIDDAQQGWANVARTSFTAGQNLSDWTIYGSPEYLPDYLNLGVNGQYRYGYALYKQDVYPTSGAQGANAKLRLRWRSKFVLSNPDAVGVQYSGLGTLWTEVTTSNTAPSCSGASVSTLALVANMRGTMECTLTDIPASAIVNKIVDYELILTATSAELKVVIEGDPVVHTTTAHNYLGAWISNPNWITGYTNPNVPYGSPYLQLYYANIARLN